MGAWNCSWCNERYDGNGVNDRKIDGDYCSQKCLSEAIQGARANAEKCLVCGEPVLENHAKGLIFKGNTYLCSKKCKKEYY